MCAFPVFANFFVPNAEFKILKSGLLSFQLPVVRGPRGFGLTLRGGCPTLISRVSGPAERVGFRPNDVILRVNNQSVETLHRERVTQIIR